ncbi:hypothetical protein M409DRAFT_22202 [Zasmidium cellare ATCC 36951]|uniref:RING-type domain-containing protein n=1 Tax=Zasmidium cellare ATCC 36951 TaxID=1080233 RepID=A0A6A6CK29_ZASCE|nr:uncharacterized protein M409DRAFT_22202 [Zasmidium cellare ATCC 36951]KAF2167391.1 hypothetical protein M409DRAFT_22202 [Zasmidium cellare ATCC 36951]
MSSDTAAPLVEQEFRRLDLEMTEHHQADLDSIQDANPGPHNEEQIAQELGDTFYNSIISYKTAASHALGERSANPSLSQEALDEIWHEYTQAIGNIEKCAVRLAFCDAALTGESKERLVDKHVNYQYAEAKIQMANMLVDELNLPYRVMRARAENPVHATLVDGHRVARQRSAEQWHRKLENAQSNEDDEELDEEKVNQLSDDWDEDIGHLKERESVIETVVGEQFLSDLWMCHAEYIGIKIMEEDIEQALYDLRMEWFPEEFDEEDQEFHEDWMSEEEDDGVDVTWLPRDFKELRDQMSSPTNITVDVAQLSNVEEPTIFQTQLLDNECSVCLLEFKEPTELVRCHHLFCFKCIVPCVDAYKKCPKCRGPADLHDLKIYKINRVGLKGAEGGDGDSKTEDGEAVKKDAEHADEHAKAPGTNVVEEISDVV